MNVPDDALQQWQIHRVAKGFSMSPVEICRTWTLIDLYDATLHLDILEDADVITHKRAQKGRRR